MRTPTTEARSSTDIETLERQAAIINGDMDWILGIHEETPDPSNGRSIPSLLGSYLLAHQQPFALPAPERPKKPDPLPEPAKPLFRPTTGIISKLFSNEGARRKAHEKQLDEWQQQMILWERANAQSLSLYQQRRAAWAEQYAQWQADAAAHAELQSSSDASLRNLFSQDQAFFEQVLSVDLSQIEWPRETTITFEVQPANSLVLLDIDLPEIEDIPPQTAQLNARQTDLIIRDKTEKKKRLEYARHVHGCLFRLMGEVFSSLPFRQVTISGFTQCLHPDTGRVEDDYILKCTAVREQFSSLNFDSLELVDPIAALERFDLQRNMTSTGIFKPLRME